MGRDSCSLLSAPTAPGSSQPSVTAPPNPSSARSQPCLPPAQNLPPSCLPLLAAGREGPTAMSSFSGTTGPCFSGLTCLRSCCGWTESPQSTSSNPSPQDYPGVGQYLEVDKAIGS